MAEARKPVLDPLSRSTEAIFGLLMALSFTGAAAVASAENEMQILWAALGCNLAWGLTDAVIYLLATLIERGQRAKFLNDLRSAHPEEAEAMLRDTLADWGPGLLSSERVNALSRWFKSGAGAPPTRLTRDDLRAAAAVFITVVLATFPPVIPILLIEDGWLGLRISNVVSLVTLGLLGRVLDRLIGARWRFTVLMPVIGALLVIAIIALGG